LWNLVTPWINRYNQITGDNVNPDSIVSWDIASYLNIWKDRKDLFLNILNYDDFWDDVYPLNNSQLYLWQMIQNNAIDVYITTASYSSNIKNKYKRFKELFPYIKEEQIIAIHDKSLLNVDYIIDDNPKNLVHNNSCSKLLYKRNHNINDRKGFICINNLAEANEYIQSIEHCFKGGVIM
jgi:5'(3')-deoxyribonucleotidase